MCVSRLSVLVVFSSLLLCAVAVCHPSYADIYKYVDKNGHLYFTDRPKPGYRLILKSGKSSRESKIDYRNKEANRKRFALKIAAVARSQALPEGLIHAVIDTESAYDPNAVSRKGAVGLMQLMPETARRYGVSNRHDPAENLSGGARYLKDLLKRFGNNIELAIAGYNAGASAVEKYGNQIPPFIETQSYVRKVLKLYQQYAKNASTDTY
jgi:soluble lytic murein transglycosylase-like protein